MFGDEWRRAARCRCRLRAQCRAMSSTIAALFYAAPDCANMFCFTIRFTILPPCYTRYFIGAAARYFSGARRRFQRDAVAQKARRCRAMPAAMPPLTLIPHAVRRARRAYARAVVVNHVYAPRRYPSLFYKSCAHSELVTRGDTAGGMALAQAAFKRYVVSSRYAARRQRAPRYGGAQEARARVPLRYTPREFSASRPRCMMAPAPYAVPSRHAAARCRAPAPARARALRYGARYERARSRWRRRCARKPSSSARRARERAMDPRAAATRRR